MKKLQLLNWMLFALLAFTFSACDNEPLEGEFITGGGGEITAEEGQFVANIGGVSFLAETTNNLYNPDIGALIISGAKQDGESIFLAVNNAGVGTFDLTTIDNTSNSGTYFQAGSIFNPFLTNGLAGGSGQLDITTFDVDNLTVSGTFAIVGVRPQLDADGNPVLDGDGNPTFESVTISEGSFNAIPITIDTSTGGGGGGVGVDPDPEFFALVEGEEFIDETFTAEKVTVAGEPMVKIVATSTQGAVIRIDIPEGLGTGTFNFVDPISDGTKLIAIYTTPDGRTYTSGEFVDTGSITLTEFGGATGKLAASFSFLASDVVPPIDTRDFEITEGSFNIDYINDSGVVENSFSADIDGVAYTPSSIEVSQAPFGSTTRITVTTIEALSNQSLTISFPIDIEVGSHEMTTAPVDGSEKIGLYNPDIGNSILFASEPGTLTITSYELSSGIVEATFSFTGVDPASNDSTEYAITNGVFVIQY